MGFRVISGEGPSRAELPRVQQLPESRLPEILRQQLDVPACQLLERAPRLAASPRREPERPRRREKSSH